MTFLVLGLLVFFAAHAIPMAPPVAAGLERTVGKAGRKGVVALLAAVGFVLIVVGKAQAPLVALWPPPEWGRHLALGLMPFAFVLLAAAYVPKTRIRTLARNPMLAAIILWAAGHLAANGDAASALLFGGFLVFAIVDWWSVSRRTAPLHPHGALTGDMLAAGAGLLAYAVVLVAHPYLFGVPALA